MTFTLAIFDLDGTLMDTSPGIFATANATIEKMGLKPLHDLERLSKFIGPPITRCFEEVYELDTARSKEAVEIYRTIYEESGRFNARPYPLIKETLQQLQESGYLLAVGTLKLESLALQMMEHFDMARFFTSIRGSDFNSTLSKADIVRNVLNDLSIGAEQAVLIGDTVHDQIGAKDSGVSFIAVDYGFGFPKGKEREDSMHAMIERPEQLLTIL